MGTDLALSFSGSSSATSGAEVNQKGTFGDFIVGGSGGSGQKSPPWLWLGLGALALVAVVVFFVRRR